MPEEEQEEDEHLNGFLRDSSVIAYTALVVLIVFKMISLVGILVKNKWYAFNSDGVSIDVDDPRFPTEEYAQTFSDTCCEMSESIFLCFMACMGLIGVLKYQYLYIAICLIIGVMFALKDMYTVYSVGLKRNSIVNLYMTLTGFLMAATHWVGIVMLISFSVDVYYKRFHGQSIDMSST